MKYNGIEFNKSYPAGDLGRFHAEQVGEDEFDRLIIEFKDGYCMYLDSRASSAFMRMVAALGMQTVGDWLMEVKDRNNLPEGMFDVTGECEI